MIDVMSNEAIERVNLILSGVPKGAEKALSSIITRARSTVRSTALSQITSVYDIKAKDVRDRQNTTINMRTRRAEGGIVGEVSFSGSKIPLYRFGVSPKKPKPGTPVKARQMKSKPLTMFNDAFIAEMKSGHIGIFERAGRKRFPVEEIMGASTAQMVGNSVVLEKVEAAAMDTITKRAEHEITRILNGYGG